MLIINAPSFFSMFWGLLKKFIDPRTAQRIQVFSNSAKGLAALRKLVDEHEIPVDYGGTNKSLKQAFVDEASDPLLRRQEIELVYVKRRGRAALSKDIVLNADESIFIRVYTRSWSGANVTVRAGSKVCAEAQARCLWRNENAGPTDSADVPMPHCTVVAEKIPGPGMVTIQLDDLDDAVSDKKLSRGYFLVVCDIRINE
jgi:CRAL/TRIO domain